MSDDESPPSAGIQIIPAWGNSDLMKPHLKPSRPALTVIPTWCLLFYIINLVIMTRSLTHDNIHNLSCLCLLAGWRTGFLLQRDVIMNLRSLLTGRKLSSSSRQKLYGNRRRGNDDRIWSSFRNVIKKFSHHFDLFLCSSSSETHWWWCCHPITRGVYERSITDLWLNWAHKAAGCLGGNLRLYQSGIHSLLLLTAWWWCWKWSQRGLINKHSG